MAQPLEKLLFEGRSGEKQRQKPTSGEDTPNRGSEAGFPHEGCVSVSFSQAAASSFVHFFTHVTVY